MNNKEHYEKLMRLLKIEQDRLKISEPQYQIRITESKEETIGLHFHHTAETYGHLLIKIKPCDGLENPPAIRQYSAKYICHMGLHWRPGVQNKINAAANSIKPYLDSFRLVYYKRKLIIVLNLDLTYETPEHLVKDMDAIVQYFWERIENLRSEIFKVEESIVHYCLEISPKNIPEHKRSYKVGQYSL